MSNSPFANSKSALVFAGVTIVGALMFTSSHKGGSMRALPADDHAQQQQQAEIVEEAPIASGRGAEAIEPLDPAAGWGGTAAPVFGEYNAEEMAQVEPGEEESPPARVPSPSPPPAARRDSIGGVVKADNPGVLVPRPGSMSEDARPRPEPVVTSRTMTIEP